MVVVYQILMEVKFKVLVIHRTFLRGFPGDLVILHQYEFKEDIV